MGRRSGFTLIETVFAIFIFAIGALGLAGTTAVVIRSLAVSGARERSARIASARVETLRSLSCGAAQSGSESINGIQTSWSVSPTGAGLSITATVSYSVGGSMRSDSYATLAPCLP
jgi:prepilin-type N-terminal cleavage/methylation domain-containing protein